MALLVSMGVVPGLAVLCSAQSPPSGTEGSAWVQPGDRIVLVGSGWVERMHHHPWLETMLTLQVPGVTFRNIGWSGDTVFGDARAVFGSRADGYQRLNRDMDYAAPKLAILCYGENEAFGNAQERAGFLEGYRRLIQDLQRHECRTVLVIPRARERAGAEFPDPTRTNQNLAVLADGIRKLAQELPCGLIDLEHFSPSERFTSDGVAWSDEGYRQSAREIMKQLGFSSLAIDRVSQNHPSAIPELQRLIRAKNEWFFHRYRPQNETYLFLFRKHEQGNNAMEVDQMERHVAEGEKAIASWCLEQESKCIEKPLPIRWQIEPLALDANEGCAIGDIDGDGSLDIVAGRAWYSSPSFTPRPLRTIEDWNGYVQSNGDFLFDVNRDGRLDVIAGSFVPTELAWYENPGPEGWRLGHMWSKRHWVDTQATENEAQLMADVDRDGIVDWVVNSWNPKNPMTVWRLVDNGHRDGKSASYQLERKVIGNAGNQHGMGVGDINGDGRPDILCGHGWYEQPEKCWESEWAFHANWNIQGSIPMLVVDLDRDGKNDVIVGQGHNYGLYWWRTTGIAPDGSIQYEEKTIDKSFSQPHALAVADLDGDGRDELITGKRYYAHNGGDPGGQDMPEINAYTFVDGKFTKSPIEQGHVGIGLQIATGDLNGDGRIDIAVAGKSGTYALLNRSP